MTYFKRDKDKENKKMFLFLQVARGCYGGHFANLASDAIIRHEEIKKCIEQTLAGETHTMRKAAVARPLTARESQGLLGKAAWR